MKMKKTILNLSLIALLAGGINNSYSQDFKLDSVPFTGLRTTPSNALFYGINEFYPEEEFDSSSVKNITLKLNQKSIKHNWGGIYIFQISQKFCSSRILP